MRRNRAVEEDDAPARTECGDDRPAAPDDGARSSSRARELVGAAKTHSDCARCACLRIDLCGAAHAEYDVSSLRPKAREPRTEAHILGENRAPNASDVDLSCRHRAQKNVAEGVAETNAIERRVLGKDRPAPNLRNTAGTNVFERDAALVNECGKSRSAIAVDAHDTVAGDAHGKHLRRSGQVDHGRPSAANDECIVIPRRNRRQNELLRGQIVTAAARVGHVLRPERDGARNMSAHACGIEMLPADPSAGLNLDDGTIPGNDAEVPVAHLDDDDRRGANGDRGGARTRRRCKCERDGEDRRRRSQRERFHRTFRVASRGARVMRVR